MCRRLGHIGAEVGLFGNERRHAGELGHLPIAVFSQEWLFGWKVHVVVGNGVLHEWPG